MAEPLKTNTPSALRLRPNPEIPFSQTRSSTESRPTAIVKLHLHVHLHFPVNGDNTTASTNLRVTLPRDSKVLWAMIEIKYISDERGRSGFDDTVPIFWKIKSDAFEATNGGGADGTEKMYARFKAFCETKLVEEVDRKKKAGIEERVELCVDANVDIDFLLKLYGLFNQRIAMK